MLTGVKNAQTFNLSCGNLFPQKQKFIMSSILWKISAFLSVHENE